MAGDLMFAHAEYHSTYPLPICGTIHSMRPVIEPGKIIAANVRKVSFATDESEDFTTDYRVSERELAINRPHKPDTYERYKALLSETEWTPTRDFCRALHLRAESVNRYLDSRPDVVEKTKILKMGVMVNYWKLK